MLLPDRAGDDLHRASAVVAPDPYPDFAHAAASRGKQGRMPCKEPFGGERLVIVPRGVKHHFDDAFDIAVCRLERTEIHAEATRNRGSDLFSVQPLAFDLTTLEHVGGQSLQDRLLAKVEAERFHVAYQPALPVPDGGQRFGEALPAPIESGPILKLMDVHSPHLLRRL